MISKLAAPVPKAKPLHSRADDSSSFPFTSFFLPNLSACLRSPPAAQPVDSDACQQDGCCDDGFRFWNRADFAG
jgi:hypothetical protein